MMENNTEGIDYYIVYMYLNADHLVTHAFRIVNLKEQISCMDQIDELQDKLKEQLGINREDPIIILNIQRLPI